MNELETALHTVKMIVVGAVVINGLLLTVLAAKLSRR